RPGTDLEEQRGHQDKIIPAHEDDLDIPPAFAKPLQATGRGNAAEAAAEDHDPGFRGPPGLGVAWGVHFDAGLSVRAVVGCHTAPPAFGGVAQAWLRSLTPRVLRSLTLPARLWPTREEARSGSARPGRRG